MAFSTDSMAEVFKVGTVTVASGALTIPSGSIRSFIPSAANTGVREMIFGLVDTISSAVATGNMTNISVTQGASVVDGGTTLRKTYNFVINLAFDNDDVDDVLDVKPE